MAQILGAGGQQITPNEETPLDITKTTAIECEKCGGGIFVQGFGFRRISKLVSGKTKDEVLPVELFLCGDCGEVLNELLPTGLKVENK